MWSLRGSVRPSVLGLFGVTGFDYGIILVGGGCLAALRWRGVTWHCLEGKFASLLIFGLPRAKGSPFGPQVWQPGLGHVPGAGPLPAMDKPGPKASFSK